MLETIVVPINDWKDSDIAVGYAASLAGAFSARVVLIGIISNINGNREFIDPVLWNANRCEWQSILNEHVQFLKARDIVTESEIMEAPSLEQLFQFIEDSACDIIVTTASKNHEGWLIESLLKHTNSPVYLTREETPPIAYSHILVALDGSQRAESSLNLATGFARQTGAQLHLCHVVQQPEIPRKTQMTAEDLEMANRLTQRNTEEAKKYLDEVASRLAGDVRTHICVNEKVSASLHDLIAEDNIDLLILSAHGYSGEPKWPLGTVAENLVRYSQVPTVIVQDLPAHIDTSQPEPIRMTHHEAH